MILLHSIATILHTDTHTLAHALARDLPTFLHPFFSFHAYHLSPPFFQTNTIPLFLHLHTRLRAHTGNSAGNLTEEKRHQYNEGITHRVWTFIHARTHTTVPTYTCKHTQTCQHTHRDTHINTLPPQLLSLDRFSDLEDPESPSAQRRVALCFHWNWSLHFSNLVSCTASKHVLTIYGDRREAHTAEQCIYFSLPHWIVLPVRHMFASADANVERGQETAEWHHLQDILKIPELPKHLLYYDKKTLWMNSLCQKSTINLMLAL